MAEFDPSILVSEHSKRVADMNWFSTEVGGEGEERKEFVLYPRKKKSKVGAYDINYKIEYYLICSEK